MMDIRRAAALLLALVMIAALTVGCGKKQSDTPTDRCRCGRPDSRPAAGEAGVLQRVGDAAVRAGGGYVVLG